MTLKAPLLHTQFHTNTMTKSVAISLLRQGNTGTEILEILDALSENSSDTSGAQVTQVSPTLLEIQF